MTTFSEEINVAAILIRHFVLRVYSKPFTRKYCAPCQSRCLTHCPLQIQYRIQCITQYVCGQDAQLLCALGEVGKLNTNIFSIQK